MSATFLVRLQVHGGNQVKVVYEWMDPPIVHRSDTIQSVLEGINSE
jgi:hypothetical protein